MRILVVGGGIGGLTLALALRQAGLDGRVYEQAGRLREVGAGLTMAPNAVKVLHRLGLAEALHDVATLPHARDVRDWQSGEVLAQIPLRDTATARWGAPYYMMHRADLHNALRRRLGDEYITLGARCVSVDQDAEQVTACFADGRRVTGDLLIGADGIHSVVREYVAGADRPTWCRQVAWRGLAPASVGREVGLEPNHHLYWGPGKVFVTYYVSAGRLVNWVGVVQSDDDWQEESWSARGDRAEALAHYADWHEPVRTLIAGTESIFRWALFDRPPLATWLRGRVVLLGDAAHPMLPHMGQGAAQSIEDAAMLARCLAADRDDPQRAIEAYVGGRRERAALLQTASRESGISQMLSDPAEIAARNARLRGDAATQLAAFDWLWGYDVASPAVAQ